MRESLGTVVFEGEGSEYIQVEEAADPGILMTCGEGHDEQFHDREAENDSEGRQQAFDPGADCDICSHGQPPYLRDGARLSDIIY